MPRLVFKPNELNKYISHARSKLLLKRDSLATLLGISGRTLADWQREKYLPDQSVLIKLSKLANIPLPLPTEIREDWWSGKVNGSSGALARFKKYGCSYSLEKRKLGGHNSQLNRKMNPEYYAKLGCPIPRDFIFPSEDSTELAEFIGILLGDGCIQQTQVSITLNTIADSKYINYVTCLIFKLFSYKASVRSRWPTKATTILISGRDFTMQLIARGMKTGDKVKQQVDVPIWIKRNMELSRYCLRGLMDTDGGIFTHSYTINNKPYSYTKTCFTNASQPLLDFVYQTLINNGFHPNNKVPRKIWLHSQVESKRYLEVIGSSNERLLKKIQ